MNPELALALSITNILCFHMTSRGIHIWVSAIMEPLGSVI